MREYNKQSRWQQIRGKNRPHWGILTLDDLDKTNGKHSRLITKLQARYQAEKKGLGDDKPRQQESEDYSI